MVGFLSFAAKVVIPGRAFLRRLYSAIDKSAYYIHITPLMRADLDWWQAFLKEWNGIHLLRIDASRQECWMWTDASGLHGLGGYLLDYPD